jgi:nicotinamidase-related amidase
MDAMLVVHMQVGLLSGMPKHELHGVVDRINRLAARVRAQTGKVILIQHWVWSNLITRRSIKVAATDELLP